MALDFDLNLLQFAGADYDVDKIGFVVIRNAKKSDTIDMDVEMELESPRVTPKRKPRTFDKAMCLICSKSFFNKAGLRRHLLNVHTTPETIAELTSPSKPAEEKSTAQEEPTKTFNCDYCGRMEATKKLCLRHMRTHRLN